MNRKEINDCISARIWNKGGLKGAVYTIWINDWKIPCNALKELRKRAVEGDLIRIKYWHSWRGMRNFSFVISFDDYMVDLWRKDRVTVKKQRSPRDTQRAKVYRWERSHLPDSERLNETQINLLVFDIYDTYGFPNREPKVTISTRKYRTSSYYPLTHEIKLAAGWGQGKMTVLHEIAHALIKTMGLDKKIASHGREFVGLFMELCELWLNLSDREISVAKAEGTELGAEHRMKYN